MSETKRYYETQNNKNTIQQRIQKIEEKIKELENLISSKVK